MILGYTVVQIMWYFLVYSVLGWCVEVVYCTVVTGRVVNRGFLNGPVCPIYGFGMLMVLALLRCAGYENASEADALILFFGGMILASSVELFAGWAMMKLFHTRWWDYSDQPFNLGGFICLRFSCIWGIGAVLVIRVCHTPLAHLVESRLSNMLPAVAGLVLADIIYLADLILTVATIVGINRRLAELDELGRKLHELSEELSERIGTKALETDRALAESRVQASLAKAELRDAVEKAREDFTASGVCSRILGRKRMLKAFPQMKHLKYNDLLEELKQLIEERTKEK